MRYVIKAPVLWRRDGETQVGIEEPRVFTGLTPSDQHTLALMEGPGVSTLTGLSGAGVSAFRELELAEVAQSLPDAPSSSPVPSRPIVAIHGLGAPGVALAECLARVGYDLELCDLTPLARESRHTFAGARGAVTCASAAADLVRRAVPGATVRLAQASAHLAVVIGVGHCDPAVTVPLMSADLPHVLVTCDELGAWVGPIVIPGETACATCVGLHHADRDPLWPRVSVQLSVGRRPRLRADAVAGIVALASAAVVAHGSRETNWIGGSQWRVVGGRPPEPRAIPPHPACGCGAATGMGEPATDELAARRARLEPPNPATPLRTW